MVEVKSLTSRKLSYFRTLHNFNKYAEASSLEEFQWLCEWAAKNNTKVFVLGNGSNILFTKKEIKSLVIKNSFPKFIKPLSERCIEVSSSVLLVDVLKYCYENSWNSFYYLASVPATIGGALAMNAGGDRSRTLGGTIYDFVESVTYFEGGEIKTLRNEEIVREHRLTTFTGIHEKIIVSAVFKFSAGKFDCNPILERIEWSKTNQDHSAPNCGTVFKEANGRLLDLLKGLSYRNARYSKKSGNWILNNSESTGPIFRLISVAKLLHFLVMRKIVLELVVVE